MKRVRKTNTRLKCLLLGFVTLVIYLQSASNRFVNYDDPQYVTSNTHVQRGLTWGTFRWAVTSNEAANWHPLTWVSHALDWQIFGQNAWGHHLTSVLIHTLNVVLAFMVLRRLTGSDWRSFTVAALFGLHPLRVESVAWVAERKDVLSAFFLMSILWAYAKYVSSVERLGKEKSEIRNSKSEGKSKFEVQNASFWYCLTLLFLVLGLMSKPMVVTAPFLLLLLDYWPLARWKIDREKPRIGTLTRLMLEKVPFFALAAISSAITFTVQQHGGAVKTMTALPLGLRIENTAVSYCRYILKIIWPVDLSVFYPFPDHWPASYVVASASILMVVSVAAISRVRTRPYFFVGWFWFVGTLIPVIGLVQVGDQSLADHYTYVPSLGLLMALVWGASEA